MEPTTQWEAFTSHTRERRECLCCNRRKGKRRGYLSGSLVAQSCPTLCNSIDCSMPSFPVHRQFLEVAQTHIHQVGDATQPSHPLLSPSSPTFNLSQNQGLFHESVLPMRWPKYWNFNFSISPSNEYSGLISFRLDWLDLLVVQGTLKSLLQHHSSKESILRRSAFFMVQLSHSYMTTGKTSFDYTDLCQLSNVSPF